MIEADIWVKTGRSQGDNRGLGQQCVRERQQCVDGITWRPPVALLETNVVASKQPTVVLEVQPGGRPLNPEQ